MTYVLAKCTKSNLRKAKGGRGKIGTACLWKLSGHHCKLEVIRRTIFVANALANVGIGR